MPIHITYKRIAPQNSRWIRGYSIDSLIGFEPLPAGWRCELPVQFIRGADSDYVGDAELALVREHFPDARIDTINGAGHWLHAEKPVEFVRLVQAFL